MRHVLARRGRLPSRALLAFPSRALLAFPSRALLAFPSRALLAFPSRALLARSRALLASRDRARLAALLTAALAVGLAAALAGCGSSPAKVTLPKKPPPHVKMARAGPVRQTPQQLVIAAYEGYWRATNEALDSRSANRARAILADYIPSSAIPGLVRGLRMLWQRDEVSYGSPVLHITGVTLISARSAAVHDCVDMSHAGLADRKTGQLVGGLGQAHENLITKLILEHGIWLVTGETPVVQACSY